MLANSKAKNSQHFVLCYSQQGFALVPIVLMLTLLGVLAFISTRETASSSALIENVIERDTNTALQQAAQAHSRWTAQSNNCQLPENVTGVAFAGGSYDMSFSGTPSNYTMTTTTTKADGSQSVEVLQNQRLYDYDNVRLLNATASADAYLKFQVGKWHENKGSDNVLHISSEWDKLERIIYRFDTSSIPIAARINSAVLTVNVKDHENHEADIYLHSLTSDWDENTVSNSSPWATNGGDYDALAATVFQILGDGPVTSDLTKLTSDWVSGRKDNFGVLLRMESSSTKEHMKIHSREAGDTALHPKLAVNYVCPCGESCEAGIVLDDIRLAYEKDAVLNGQAFTPNDLLYVARSKSSAEIELEGDVLGFPDSIAAAHLLSNGRYMLSFDQNFVASGVTYGSEDIVEYDAESGTFRMVLDGSAIGLDKKINAVTMSPSGRLAISVNGNHTVFGNSYQASDLFYIDLEANSSEMLFDGSTFGIGEKIVAAHILETGELVLGLQGGTTVDGADYNKGDLLQFDLATNTAKMYFAGSQFDQNDNIQALHVGEGQGSLSKLEFHFPFSEQTGSTANDVVGSRTGTISDMPDWRSGGWDGMLAFNGSTNNLQFPDDAATRLDDSFSLMFWVQHASGQTGQKWLINKSDAVNNNDSFLAGFENDQFQWGLEKTGENVRIGPLNGITADQWHHIAIVVDAAANRATTFIDGTAVNSAPVDFELSANNNSWLIGDEWRGSLDELILYAYPLTADEIAGHAKKELIAPGVGPMPLSASEPDVESKESNSEEVAAASAVQGCNGAVADYFDSKTYSNSNGTVDWVDPWLEYRDDDSPSSGKISIFGSDKDKPLLLTDADRAVYRKVPFSYATGLEFSFDVRGTSLGAGEYVSVRVTNNGPGNDWQDLDTIDNTAAVTAASGNRRTYDISSYISENTYIAFHTSDNMEFWDWVSIDNVVIRCR